MRYMKNHLLRGAVTAGAIALTAYFVSLSRIDAGLLQSIGGDGIFCQNTGPTKCIGVLPDSECGDVTSMTCNMLGVVPNGTTTCKANNNQSNACAGQPSTFCIPPDMSCF